MIWSIPPGSLSGLKVEIELKSTSGSLSRGRMLDNLLEVEKEYWVHYDDAVCAMIIIAPREKSLMPKVESTTKHKHGMIKQTSQSVRGSEVESHEDAMIEQTSQSVRGVWRDDSG